MQKRRKPNNLHTKALLMALSLLFLVGCQMPAVSKRTSQDDSGASIIDDVPPSNEALADIDPHELGFGDLLTQPLPDSILLTVQGIAQNPELPNGCEATSLSILLTYLGMDADKVDIAYNWLPSQAFDYSGSVKTGGDPELVYTGDPAGDGYYCFAAPVTRAANLFMQENGIPFIAYDITGADEQELVVYLVSGHPVIVWTTIDNGEPYALDSNAWLIEGTDEWYVPYSNLHVMVLHGYDEDYFYFRDPLEQYTKLLRSEFVLHYTQMGSRAVVIY